MMGIVRGTKIPKKVTNPKELTSMNKKGQALVEFVIILPIFLLLVLGVIDIGQILYNRTKLEGVITDVISMYEKGISISDIKEEVEPLELKMEEDGDYLLFHLVKEVDIITPGLNFILDDPYQIEVSRSIYNE